MIRNQVSLVRAAADDRRQDLKLVAKDEQLDVRDVQTAATQNERSQQRPVCEVEK
jgi:hypothetical protein